MNLSRICIQNATIIVGGASVVQVLSKRQEHPDVAIHQFGSGNAKIEQRFLLGAGAKGSPCGTPFCATLIGETLRDFWKSRHGP
jgi:hypothetical protein